VSVFLSQLAGMQSHLFFCPALYYHLRPILFCHIIICGLSCSAMLSSVAYPVLPYFFILLLKRYVCRKNCTQSVKVATTEHEGQDGEYSCSSTLPLTSALSGVVQSTPRPGRFTSGRETRYSLYCCTQGRSIRVRKISCVF
jgi:hypothetical protein